MPEYIYSRLSRPTSIRLLQLLPSDEDATNLQCKIFEYPLRDSDKQSHPYEALSYTWGSEERPKSITLNNKTLHITQNLYTALLRLQNHVCSRIIWVDAICINQANEKEKEDQIPLMAEIYAKALRVVAWLGEAENDGDRALETIRLVGEKSPKFSKADLKHEQQKVLQLLQRPWFQRIWVSN
jgi:hypothetical protein